MSEQVIKKKKQHLANSAELRDLMIMKWHKLDMNGIMNHIHSMHKMIQAVITAGCDKNFHSMIFCLVFLLNIYHMGINLTASVKSKTNEK